MTALALQYWPVLAAVGLLAFAFLPKSLDFSVLSSWLPKASAPVGDDPRKLLIQAGSQFLSAGDAESAMKAFTLAAESKKGGA